MRIAAAVLIAASSGLRPQPPAQPAPPQPAAPSAPTETVASLAPPLQSIVRQRALHFYKMPDGTIWDGWEEWQYRQIMGRSLTALTKLEPAHGTPGNGFVEDKPIGTAWHISVTADIKAWDLLSRLGDERGELRDRVLERADPRTWNDAPPLWSSLQARDFSWDFALVDEDHPDEYTRQTNSSYLRITRVWGDDRFEFKGYSLDRGETLGIVTVPNSKRWVRQDRFKGAFFLWPEGTLDQPGGTTRQAWRLIPEDQLRMSPDDLADALIAGRAELSLWTHEIVHDHELWKRSTRQIDLATPREPKPQEPKKPAPPANVGGPDLIILKDGRWFRGQITRHDAHSVTIRTPIGQMESEVTFTMDEVKEVQEPEHR